MISISPIQKVPTFITITRNHLPDFGVHPQGKEGKGPQENVVGEKLRVVFILISKEFSILIAAAPFPFTEEAVEQG